MDIDGLPVIGSGVDFTQVGSIHQKRTLAFINHFVTNTVSFLNKFSRSCEVRLQKCESKIQKLEASLAILEAKLTSIPGLDGIIHPAIDSVGEGPSDPITADLPSSAMEDMPCVTSSSHQTDVTAPEPLNAVPVGMIPANQDPVFKRYLRMLHVGVPEPAVRLKMQAEGLDPNILSNPDQLVPASAIPTASAEESSSQQSSGSFSD